MDRFYTAVASLGTPRERGHGARVCLASTGEPFPVPPDAELEVALEIKVENEAELFLHSEVLGVGVGTLEDTPTAAAIVLYIESPSHHVPGWVPASIEGIPTRVILTDRIVAQ